MTETPKRRTDRLTPEQRAEIKARVAPWPPPTEAQRAKVAILFAGYFSPPDQAILVRMHN
jgi:hypothetical protein